MPKGPARPVQGYIVVWGNGFAGLFDTEFEQLCNGPVRTALDDALHYGVKCAEILTPAELDAKRGCHREDAAEVFGALAEKAETV